ncbi:MAG: hypothetical protein HRT44_05410 [Bdellovibrionales bacterium]|nr:hypothetical protein [Bdellovibrionales bacterium]
MIKHRKFTYFLKKLIHWAELVFAFIITHAEGFVSDILFRLLVLVRMATVIMMFTHSHLYRLISQVLFTRKNKENDDSTNNYPTNDFEVHTNLSLTNFLC